MGNSSSTSSFPYSIKSLEYNSSPTFPWSFHSGTRKSDDTPVTVFKLSKSDVTHPYILQSATQHFTKSKTLIHPHVLRTFDTLDTDAGSNTNMGELVIVTEEVIPLKAYLESNEMMDVNAENAIAWGLYCIINALHFLHETAKVSHGLLSMDSIYVTPGGDWKLGNFGLLTSIEARGVSFNFRECDEMVCPAKYRSPERLQRKWELITSPHVVDAYSFGVLIEEIYSFRDGVPDILIKAVKRLKSSSPKMRPRINPLLKCPLFKNNKLIKSLQELDDFSTALQEEKIYFLQNLSEPVTKGFYGKPILVYKLLPLLLSSLKIILQNQNFMTQENNRREVMAILPLLFLIIEKSPQDKAFFDNNIAPILTQLFTVNDRGVRGALLTRVSLLMPYFDKSFINNSIFEPICSGFTDSSAALRELTLKSALPLLQYLNVTSLDKLARYLIRLQSDSEASIRTNSMIFIGKSVPFLTSDKCQKILLAAFFRGMKDQFTPCRIASLKTVLECHEYFTIEELAQKLLPALIPFCIDPDPSVRAESMKVVDFFMQKLKKGYDAMNQNSSIEEEKDFGYFSGITSYFSSDKQDIKQTLSVDSDALPNFTHNPPSTASNQQKIPYNQYPSSKDNGWDESQWEEEDDNDLFSDDPSDKQYDPPSNVQNDPFASDPFASGSFASDPFASIGLNKNQKKPTRLVIQKKQGTKVTSASLAERKAEYERKKAVRSQFKPVKKLNTINDGWDDF